MLDKLNSPIAICFYVVVFFTFAFITLKQTRKIKLIYTIIVFSIYAFIVMFRVQDNSFDYNNYINSFYIYSNPDYDFFSRKCPLFAYIIYLLHYISDVPQIIYIIIGAFSVFSFARFTYKYSPNIYISTIAFQALMLLDSSGLNGFRQFFAAAIMLFGYDILLSNKKFKFRYIIFISLILISYFIHKSSFVCIVFPITLFMFKENKSFNTLVLLFVMFAICSIGVTFSLENDYVSYSSLDTYGTTPANILGILPILLISVSGLYVQYKNKTLSLYKVSLSNTLIVLFFKLLSIFSMIIAARISCYFIVFTNILLAFFPAYLMKKKSWKFKTIFCVIFLSLIYLCYIITGKVAEITGFIF